MSNPLSGQHERVKERSPLPSHLRDRSFSVADAYAAGVGHGRLRSNDLARPFHGIRTQGSDPAGVEARCQASLPRLRPQQFFGRETAASLWGVPLPPAAAHEPLHIFSVSPARPPRTGGVVGHQLSERPPTCRIRGFEVTDPASTWLHLAAALSIEDLVAAGDYFIHDPVVLDPELDLLRPLTTIATLTERLAEFRAPGARAAVRALPRLHPAAESRPESLLRQLLASHRLPEPEVNTTVHAGDNSSIGRFDLVYRPWKVIVEYDGDQHRTSTRQYDRDQLRIEAAMLAGWLHIRVRAHALFARPKHTVNRVADALRGRGWSGHPRGASIRQRALHVRS